MKLRNKQTGEIVVFGEGIVDLNQIGCKNVAEMIEEGWEDYEEECKQYWYLEYNAEVLSTMDEGGSFDKWMKQIGNYFETKEEAEKAVEKLKAWKRLKDKGFKFTGWGLFEYAGCDNFVHSPQIGFSIPTLDKDEPYEYPEEIERDVDLLFVGEEGE